MPAHLVNSDPTANWRYARSLARAFAGAVIFSLPLLMTMEMWSLGFSMDRVRLLQFVLVNFLVLIGLSRVSGFEPTVSWADDALDAFAAYGVAVFSSISVLLLFAIIVPSMTFGEIAGKVAVQSVPASIGAMLASKQLGAVDPEVEEAGEQTARSSYWGQLLLMLAGALFLGLTVAPTEEMMLIAYTMTALHSVALVLTSIILLHAFVYLVGFRGQEKPAGANGFTNTFLYFSIVGYGISVLASLWLLWTFGRTYGVSPAEVAAMVAVLAFPGAVGAAIARLIA